MGKRLLWMTLGLAVGTVLMLAFRYAFHGRSTIVVDQLPPLCGVASLWLAEHKGKAPTPEEMARPITLFDDRFLRK